VATVTSEAVTLWDTHCHLDSPRLDAVRSAVVDRALQAGVTHVVIPAVMPETFERTWEVARHAGGLHCLVGGGIRPQVPPELPQAWDDGALRAVEAACDRHPPQAIGECGLDYRVDLERAPKARQMAVLRAQLCMAQVRRLPALIHCLSAHDDLLRVLKDVGPLPAGGVLHSYSGSAEQLAPFVAMGLMVSFAGPVGWANARKAPKAAAAVPAHLLLLETDTPDQAPQPVRGALNEPAHVLHVLAALAQARGEVAAATARVTTDNARRLFGAHPPAAG